MSFVGVGLMEILVILAGSAGLPSNDFVSLVQPEDYFKARNIAVSADKMAELAGKNPSDARTEIQQLLAIRWLGENADRTKKTEGARGLLEQIAAGKKAQDRHSFAKLHAAQALARIDGKPVLPMSVMPEKSLRGEALAWFPADVTMVGGYELRSSGKTSDKFLVEIRKLLSKAMSEKERAMAFDVLDAIGNVRLDRVAAAFDIADKGNARRVFVRFSGAADARRILDFIALASKGKVKLETKKGPGGEEVTFITRDEMAYAFVGNDELFFLGDPEGKNPAGLIDVVLAVKAGKKKNASDDAAVLRTVPENARALFAGELPEAARKELTGKNSPLRAAPRSFLFHVINEGKPTATLAATLKDREEAEAFAEGVLGLKQQALKALDNPPPQSEIPPKVLRRFKETLQAVKVSSEGSVVTGKVTADVAEALGDVLKLWLMERSPAPEKPEKQLQP